MSLDAGSIKRLQKALSIVDEHGTVGPRLIDDARRLWSRSRRLIRMGLVPAETLELDAMELACYALQLPNRRGKTLPTGKPGRSTLRERAEEGAEMLVGIAGGDTEEGLLDRTTRILHEMPHRTPVLDEAKILADALNLEDFGIAGIIAQAIQTARQGEGIMQLSKSMQKREQYGYWEARLKDGFHFEAVRQIAQTRLERARKFVEGLTGELAEDSADR